MRTGIRSPGSILSHGPIRRRILGIVGSPARIKGHDTTDRGRVRRYRSGRPSGRRSFRAPRRACRRRGPAALSGIHAATSRRKRSTPAPSARDWCSSASRDARRSLAERPVASAARATSAMLWVTPSAPRRPARHCGRFPGRRALLLHRRRDGGDHAVDVPQPPGRHVGDGGRGRAGRGLDAGGLIRDPPGRLRGLSARSLTSPATTAKPRPPRRPGPASMVAFSASKLVWPAIAEISVTAVPMSSEAAASPPSGSRPPRHGPPRPARGRTSGGPDARSRRWRRPSAPLPPPPATTLADVWPAASETARERRPASAAVSDSVLAVPSSVASAPSNTGQQVATSRGTSRSAPAAGAIAPAAPPPRRPGPAAGRSRRAARAEGLDRSGDRADLVATRVVGNGGLQVTRFQAPDGGGQPGERTADRAQQPEGGEEHDPPTRHASRSMRSSPSTTPHRPSAPGRRG